jgi:OFA family oxalate/formate antiporter-like MFS transporter
MPSTISETFGAGIMASVYGAVLTAWAAGGIVGPQIVAIVKDAVPDRASFWSFLIGTAFLVVGFTASLFLSDAPFAPRARGKAAAGAA